MTPEDQMVDIVAEVSARVVAGWRWSVMSVEQRAALRGDLAGQLEAPLGAILDAVRAQALAEARDAVKRGLA